MGRKFVDEGSHMSSVAMTADKLVKQTMIDSHVKRPEARRIVAREVGVAPGTFENLKRGRLKNVDWVAAKINAAVIRRIEREIERLQHELEVARRVAARPDDAAIFEAQAAIDHARKLIAGMK